MAKKGCIYLFETENEETYIIVEENGGAAKDAMEDKFARPTDFELKAILCPAKTGSYMMLDGGRLMEWSLDTKVTT